MIPVTSIRRALLAAMVLIAAAAMAAHIMFHPPLHNPGGDGISITNFTALIFTFLDVVLVTVLFCRKKTAVWGYLLNGLIVIYGIVFMVHFGWDKSYFPGIPVIEHLFTPTSPYIVLACTDFLLGYVLYNLWFMDNPKKAEAVVEARN